MLCVWLVDGVERSEFLCYDDLQRAISFLELYEIKFLSVGSFVVLSLQRLEQDRNCGYSL